MHTDQLTPEQIANLHEQLRRDSAELDVEMLSHAKSVVISSKSYLTVKEISEKLRLNSSSRFEQWKDDKLIFAFNHKGVDYFPAYALDPHNGKPYAAMARIIAFFGDEMSDWGIAFWFEAVNGYLGGKTPKATLANDPSRVIAAAQLEIEPVAHA